MPSIRALRLNSGDYVHAIHQIGDVDIWTTLVFRPTETVSEVRGFGYARGNYVPNTNTTVADLVDTNLVVSNQVLYSLNIASIDWRIIPVTPARFTGKDEYRVTMEDVDQIVSKVTLQLYLGGEKPFYEMRLAAHAVSHELDDNPVRMSCRLMENPDLTEAEARVWGQQHTFKHYATLDQNCKLWCCARFTDPPVLGGPVATIVTLSGQEKRGIE